MLILNESAAISDEKLPHRAWETDMTAFCYRLVVLGDTSQDKKPVSLSKTSILSNLFQAMLEINLIVLTVLRISLKRHILVKIQW